MKRPNRYSKTHEHTTFGLKHWILSARFMPPNSRGGINQLEWNDLMERFALSKGKEFTKLQEKEKLASDNFESFKQFVKSEK